MSNITYIGESHVYGNTTNALDMTPHASTADGDFIIVWADYEDFAVAGDGYAAGTDWNRTFGASGPSGRSVSHWYQHWYVSGETVPFGGFGGSRSWWQNLVMMTFRGVHDWSHDSDSATTASGTSSGTATYTTTSTAQAGDNADHLQLYAIYETRFNPGTAPGFTISPDANATTIVNVAPTTTTNLYLGYEILNGTGNYPVRSFVVTASAGTSSWFSSFERVHTDVAGGSNESGHTDGYDTLASNDAWAAA